MRIHAEIAPVRVGAQRLISIAGVHVDEIVRLVDDLRRDGVRDPLGDRPVRPARVHAIEILLVPWISVDRAVHERRDVRDVDDDQRSAKLIRIERLTNSLQRDDRRDFGAVCTADERQRRAGLTAAKN